MKIDDLKIQFKFNNKYYKLKIYYLDGDNYSIRLYNNKDEELFSTWIDSCCGEVTGNQEYYESNIDDVVDKVYDFYNILANSNLLITGEEDEN